MGGAISLALANAGFDVAVHYCGAEDKARSVCAQIQQSGRDAFAVQADLSTPEGCQSLVETLSGRWDRLDAVVHNAAHWSPVLLADMDATTWDTMFALNVRAPALINRGVLELLRNSSLPGGAAITHITDAIADRAAPGFAHYAASKMALESLTRSTAREWAPDIRVNAVAPGVVLPPVSMDAQEKRDAINTIPLKRIGTADHIAHTVVFLTRDAPYVTGQVWRVDGGLHTIGPMREG